MSKATEDPGRLDSPLSEGLGPLPGDAAFDAYLSTLPAPMQANIRDSMTRGESYSWKLWQAAQAAERERFIAIVHGERGSRGDSCCIGTCESILDELRPNVRAEAGPAAK